MRLEAIQVDGFGPLSGLQLGPLHQRLTVIAGPNEAGKSTLMRFVRVMLFGPWTGAGKRLGDEPLRGGAHGGTLRFAAEGEHWFIARHETRSSVRNALRTESGLALTDRSGEERLIQLRAKADRRLHESVFCFDLGDLHQLQALKDDDQRAALLSAGVSGAGVSARQALTQLDNDAGAWLAPRRAEAPINQAVQQLEAITQAIEESRKLQAHYHQQVARERQLEVEQRQLEAELDRLATRVAELGRLRQLHSLLTRREATQAALRALPVEALDQATRHELIDEARELSGVRERKQRAAQLDSEIAALEASQQALPAPPQPAPRQSTATVLWMVAGAALIAGLVLVLSALHSGSAAGFFTPLGAIGAGLVALAVVAGWRARAFDRQLADTLHHRRTQTESASSLQAQAARRHHERAELLARLGQWEQRVRTLLTQAGVGLQPGQALESVLQAQAEQAQRQLEAARHRDQRRAECDALQVELDQLLAQAPDPARWLAEASAASLANWEREERAAASQRQSLQSQLHTLAREQAQLSAQRKELERTHSLAELELTRATVEQELREQLARWVENRIARQLIETALGRFQSEHQPEIVSIASRSLQRLTAGRWQRVDFDPERGLQITAGDQQVDETALSRGTREQLYLALRLSLISHLARQGMQLPVLIDDVLVNFDPQRQEQAAELLVEFSRSHQVLYFTCHPNTVQLLRRFESDLTLVELPGDH